MVYLENVSVTCRRFVLLTTSKGRIERLFDLKLGFMLQEIALYGEFSIKETMMYFGWIFGMDTSEINDRLQFLLNFLDLPSQNRLVKNLRYEDSTRS